MRAAFRPWWAMVPFFALGSLAAPAAPPARPHVLIIVMDDMGFSDAGCYGGEIATPHLDALAAQGLRFTQFTNSARCWPSRAALLTGYYPQQVRRDSVPGVRSGAQGTRPAWARLLPEMLRPLGFRCYLSGKWHVDGQPLANGFDHAYVLEDHNNHFTPTRHVEDGQPLPPPGADYYSSTAIAEHALKSLREHAAGHANRPFFQLLAFTAPHFPLHAPAEVIARYRERYRTGWDRLRMERWQRQRGLDLRGASLSAIERDLGPPYAFPEDLKKLGPMEINRPRPWADLTAAQREFQADKMAIHAAMIECADREIGRVLDQLRVMQALDNTLILFLSDNGASAEIMVRGRGHDPDAPRGSAASFLCLGPGGSSLSNTPFRKHKTWVHEGGIATPLIAHWPAGIRARGELRHTPANVIDLVPTVLAAVGGSDALPQALPPAPARPGVNLLPVFERDTELARESLWWLHEGNRALRVGDWKIVAAGRESPWELYNLAVDRCETRDLAGDNPARVRELAALWTRQAEAYFEQARRDAPPEPAPKAKSKSKAKTPPNP